MLSQNMVHIIGSDSHSNKKRNFCLEAAVNMAREIANDYVDVLINDNPRKVLKGEKITLPEISREIKKENVLSKLKKLFKFLYSIPMPCFNTKDLFFGNSLKVLKLNERLFALRVSSYQSLIIPSVLSSY